MCFPFSKLESLMSAYFKSVWRCKNLDPSLVGQQNAAFFKIQIAAEHQAVEVSLKDAGSNGLFTKPDYVFA